MGVKFQLTGKKFGMLTIVSEAPGKYGKSRWNCVCDCGKTSKPSGGDIVRGSSRSCGCVRTKHGYSLHDNRSSTYHSWRAMKARCKPNSWMSKWYYDSGVRVCKRWDKFENFLEDMGDRPEGKTLDRFPVTRKIYSKRNCRWATPKQQSENKREYGSNK